MTPILRTSGKVSGRSNSSSPGPAPEKEPCVMSRLLTVADIANLRKCNRHSAFKWVHRNAKKHLRRNGKAWVLPEEIFVAIMNPPLDSRIVSRFDELEAQVREQTRRLDRHAKALSNLHAL